MKSQSGSLTISIALSQLKGSVFYLLFAIWTIPISYSAGTPDGPPGNSESSRGFGRRKLFLFQFSLKGGGVRDPCQQSTAILYFLSTSGTRAAIPTPKTFFDYSHPASRMGSQFSLVQKGADYFYFVLWPPVGHDHHTPKDPWTTSIRFRCGDGVAPEGVHNNFGHINYFYFFSTPRWALGHFL